MLETAGRLIFLACAMVFGISPAAAHISRLVTRCPPDSALMGQVCVDKYEASLWQVPETNNAGVSNADLIYRIKRGTVSLADLAAGNAVQVSPSSVTVCVSEDPEKQCSTCDAPAIPDSFPANGQWTQPLYAVSVAGVQPAGCVTWFQASQACRLSGKRLPSNIEWQDAAAGTPDSPTGADNRTTDCNVLTGRATPTGSRSSCKSSWGVYDMVGNLDEWVADWAPVSSACPTWGNFSDDHMCLSGASTTERGPGAYNRGGSFIFGRGSGVFSLFVQHVPYSQEGKVGFRCVR